MKEVIVRYADNGYGNAAGEIVGELIRCGECEYWTGYCTNKIWQSPTDDYLPQTYADDFCSYGERRDDERI